MARLGFARGALSLGSAMKTGTFLVEPTRHSGASRSQEPGTNDWVKHPALSYERLTRSWVPGSRLWRAPE